MADKKISALTAATTPLAGTEVFPIVQSSTTVKASISNVQSAPYSAGIANGVTYLDGSKVLTSGTALTFDGANLGVGATLSAWGSGQKAIQVPAGAIWNFSNTNMSIVQNVFSDGTEKYVNTGFASAYNQVSGTHTWSSAPSGIAGAPVTRTTRMTLDINGNLTASTGNLVIGTSGKGVDFSATPGTGTSELFADYEEGTFTPTLTCTSGTITLNSGQDLMQYTKIGRMVYISGQIVVSAISSPSGALTFNGLPFTVGNPGELSGRGAITVFGGALAITVNTVVGYYLAGGTTMVIAKYAAGDVANLAGDVSATTSFFISMQYVGA